MRFYVFTPGQPGYISAEVAIRELPVGPPDERAVHEHGVTLGDPVDGARADRGMPGRDRQGRRRLPASGTESRSSVTSSPDGIRRWTGSAATVPASTTTLTQCQ
jgi:hypothetical protein